MSWRSMAQGPLQAVDVEAGEVGLLVDVGADVPHLERGAPPEPVGLLDVGQGERLEAPLRIGHDLGEHGAGGDAQVPLAPAAGHQGGELGYGRVFEQGRDGERDAEAHPHVGHELGGEERVAAHLEEAVVAPHGGDAQQALPGPGEGAFELALGSYVGVA
jgi:hypothetical protein